MKIWFLTLHFFIAAPLLHCRWASEEEVVFARNHHGCKLPDGEGGWQVVSVAAGSNLTLAARELKPIGFRNHSDRPVVPTTGDMQGTSRLVW